METTELRECPFCGSDRVDPMPCSTESDGARQFWAVRCASCSSRGPRIDVTGMQGAPGDDSHPWDSAAILLWNQRGTAEKPFDPWELPECGPEYEVVAMNGGRRSGTFYESIHGMQFVEFDVEGDVPLEDIRIWRRVEP